MHHQMRHSEIDEAFRNRRALLEIFAQASEAVEPTKGALDNPALGLNLKRGLRSAVRHLGTNTKDLLTLMQQGRTVVAAVKEKQAQGGHKRHLFEQPFGRYPVLFIGGMDQDPHQPSLGGHGDLSFSAFTSFVGGQSAGSLFSAVCMDWLSIIRTLGLASRSSSSRIFTRNASLIRSSVPLLTRFR